MAIGKGPGLVCIDTRGRWMAQGQTVFCAYVFNSYDEHREHQFDRVTPYLMIPQNGVRALGLHQSASVQV